MVKYTTARIVDLIQEQYAGRKVYLLAPLVHNRKGHYKELFEQLIKKGFLHVRVDGDIRELAHGMKLERYSNHSIELVVDKLKVQRHDTERLLQSVEKTLRQGGK